MKICRNVVQHSYFQMQKRITGFRPTTKSPRRHELGPRTDFCAVRTANLGSLRHGFRSLKRTQMRMKFCRVIDLVPIFPTIPRTKKSDFGPARSEVTKLGKNAVLCLSCKLITQTLCKVTRQYIYIMLSCI